MNPDARTPPTSSGPHVGLILALTVNGLAVSTYPDTVRVATRSPANSLLARPPSGCPALAASPKLVVPIA
jgi:hypothetical protein